MNELRSHDERVLCDHISHFSLRLGVSVCSGKAIVDIIHIESARVSRIAHLRLLQGEQPLRLFTGGLYGAEGELVLPGPFWYLRGYFSKPGATPCTLTDFVLFSPSQLLEDLSIEQVMAGVLQEAGLRRS